MASLESVQIPRFLGVTAARELHVFVDASEEAFAAVAYYRGSTATGAVVCNLVMAKTRVATMRPITIPRMELQAAVLGSRLVKTILDAATVPVERTVYWSDAKDVLRWIW